MGVILSRSEIRKAVGCDGKRTMMMGARPAAALIMSDTNFLREVTAIVRRDAPI
jgi:hypothetical protein